MNDQTVIIDGIKWIITTDTKGSRHPSPLCPRHFLRLAPAEGYYDFIDDAHFLKCEDCKELFHLPRSYSKEKRYVINRIDAKILKNLKFINLDDEALPIAESKISKTSPYFVTALLTESKLGLRLIVYAGKRGSSKKTQIFVEPDIKRLAFDQNDLHPIDVFTKLEAIFIDSTKATLEIGEKIK